MNSVNAPGCVSLLAKSVPEVRIVSEFRPDHLQRHWPAAGSERQVHRAHTPFAYGPNDPISAEVVITGCRCRCIDGLSSGFFRANRTIEGAKDQTLMAQSRGIAGTQFRFAPRALWHRPILRLSPRTL